MEDDTLWDNWADAHVFYDALKHQISYLKDSLTKRDEIEQWKYLVDESPNGKLLIKNSMFDLLEKKKIQLLHFTRHFDVVMDEHKLCASGGCLVGSIYCTPLINEDNVLRLHNLGRYIFKKELNMFLTDTKAMHEIKPLIIEIDVPKSVSNRLAGIDYLRLGAVHLQLFKQLEYLLSQEERYKLKSVVLLRIKKSIEFLAICNKIHYENYKIGTKEFFDILNSAIQNLPILGYIYFEAVAEYLQLYSTDKMTNAYKELGEFNNWGYKELMFNLYPGLGKDFDLGRFNPNIPQLAKEIKTIKLEGVSNVEPDKLFDYIKNRLSFLVNARFFNSKISSPPWDKLKWEFDELVDYLGPLLGHLIHRELRNFSRYPDFYFYFDQSKALQIWNYWNNIDVVAPFNGVMPKGELGINPAHTQCNYKIYLGEISDKRGFSYIKKKRQLDLKIIPRLVDLKYPFMGKIQNKLAELALDT